MRNCLEKFCLARETAEALKLPGVDWVAGTSVLEVCMVSSLESPASHSKEHLQGGGGGGRLFIWGGVQEERRIQGRTVAGR